uniref:C-type lectin domain-containing protein n=1 Tax=Sarcophilus harrisii TaxID=9305 RepID=A0A7N4PP44_SARHA
TQLSPALVQPQNPRKGEVEGPPASAQGSQKGLRAPPELPSGLGGRGSGALSVSSDSKGCCPSLSQSCSSPACSSQVWSKVRTSPGPGTVLVGKEGAGAKGCGKEETCRQQGPLGLQAEAEVPPCLPSPGLEDPSDAPLARSSCPEGFSSFGSHCYGLIRYEETWSVAELLCQDYPSGHLVSLLSEAETRFVATMIAENGGSQKPIWIGLHDPQENRRWRWSSGGLFLFQSWDKGAPSQTNPNYCVILTQDSGFQAWKDELCKVRLPYICKIKA